MRRLPSPFVLIMAALLPLVIIGSIANYQNFDIEGSAYAIDGDTISINGIHIRLFGIDAEELSEPHGYRARNAMAEITQNKIVKCHLTSHHTYNRQVARCYVAGNDIGKILIENGFALDCAFYSHGLYRQFEPPNIRKTLLQKPYC